MTRSQLLAAASFLALVGALLGGRAILVSLDGQQLGHARHIAAPWPDGGKPAQVECLQTSARSSPQARALFGLEPDGGEQYVAVVVCYDAAGDAGNVALPGGMDALQSAQVLVDAGAYWLEAWMQGDPSAPFPCACSTGSACVLADGGAAPTGLTLSPGWSGAGCFRKSCSEHAGSSSWPSACGAQ